MYWGRLLAYGLGVPLIALLIGFLFLVHFASAMSDPMHPPKWSRFREATIWLGARPLHFSILEAVLRVAVPDRAEAIAILVTPFSNGLIWGFGVVWLIRFLIV